MLRLPSLRPLVEFLLLAAGFWFVAALLTYPLGFHPSAFARLDADGRFSIWNVAWVAHALSTHPSDVWNANIFYPSSGTLAYSEANLGAGVLALPVYLLTGNPYTAHNFVLLLSFVISGLGMYYLVRYLASDRRAALVAGICFSFSPYVFAHLSHIQLLLTGGLPLSLLAFHRLADRPTSGRGIWLAAAMAAQTYACAYYGVFAVLLVGFSALLIAGLRNRWSHIAYWRALATAAVVALMLVAPLARPYVVAGALDFGRTLTEADTYSVRGRAYFASAAYAHSWMLRLLGSWREVLFPGFVPILLGPVGINVGLKYGGLWSKRVWLYVSVALLAIWMSLGPRAGLYRLFYGLLPGFSLIRAPSRFGVLVLLALCVLSGFAVARLLDRLPRARLAVVTFVFLTFAVLDSVTPMRFAPVPALSAVYEALSAEPDGAVIELPLYSNRFAFLRTQYMLASTWHWKPLVGGYSDYIPDEFVKLERELGDFPSDMAFKALPDGVKYAVFHLGEYTDENRSALLRRLAAFSARLSAVAVGPDTWLFRIQHDEANSVQYRAPIALHSP